MAYQSHQVREHHCHEEDESRFMRINCKLVVATAFLIGGITGAMVTENIVSTNYREALSMQTQHEIDMLERLSMAAFQEFEIESLISVQDRLIEFANNRSEVKWISDAELNRVIGMATARTAVALLLENRKDEGYRELNSALQRLKQANINIDRDTLISTLKQQREARTKGGSKLDQGPKGTTKEY